MEVQVCFLTLITFAGDVRRIIKGMPFRYSVISFLEKKASKKFLFQLIYPLSMFFQSILQLILIYQILSAKISKIFRQFIIRFKNKMMVSEDSYCVEKLFNFQNQTNLITSKKFPNQFQYINLSAGSKNNLIMKLLFFICLTLSFVYNQDIWLSDLQIRSQTIIPNCIRQSGYVCLECEPGYKTNIQGTCSRSSLTQVIPHCVTQRRNECLECSIGYVVNSTKKCIQQIPNCRFQNDEVCTQCSFKYVLISQTKCVKEIQNCEEQDQKNCLKCKEGFTNVTSNVCLKSIANCKLQVYDGCSRCKEGYSKDSQGNCLKDENQNNQITCEQDQHLFQGQCFKNISNCEKQQGKTCDECDKNFLKNEEGLCIAIKIVNCAQSDGKNCIQCDQGFTQIEKNKCQQKIPNCQIQTDEGCFRCKKDYIKNMKGDCEKKVQNCKVQDKVCLTCQDGFSPFLGQCFKNIENCRRQQGDDCIFCNLGYQKNSEGKCIVKIKNCETQDKNVCQKCQQNYYVNDNGGCDEISEDEKENDIALSQDPEKIEDGYIPCDSDFCGNTEPLTDSEFQQFEQNKIDENQNIDILAIENYPAKKDLLKTKGDYIYTVSNQFLHIIRGFPIDQFQVISTLNLDEISDAVPVSLFVEGSKLILFAVGKHQENGITVALIYNIQDKEDVVLEKKYLFHGIWSDGRINEDTGHISFLTKSLTANEYPWFSNQENSISFLERNKIFKWIESENPIFLNFVSLSLNENDEGNFSMISVYASDPDLVYMSDRNIYLTYKVIKAGRDFTKIYKVSVWRNRIIPVGDSEMKGTIHHRYALSEISGTILRIVVTRLGWGSVTISVYVFNFKLQRYSTRGNILQQASDHEITSASYKGNRLYIGTNTNLFFYIEFNPSHIEPRVSQNIKLSEGSQFIQELNRREIIVFGASNTNSSSANVMMVEADNKNTNISQKDHVSIQINSLSFQEQKFFIYPKNRIILCPFKRPTKINGAFALQFKAKIKINAGYDHKWSFFNHMGEYSFDDSDVQSIFEINSYIYTKSKCKIIARSKNQIRAGKGEFTTQDEESEGRKELSLEC